MAMKHGNRKKKIAFALLFAAIILLPLEVGLRLAWHPPPPLYFYNNPMNVKRAGKLFLTDHKRFWRLAPGRSGQWIGKQVSIGPHGFRIPEEEQPFEETAHRLAAFGDSSTFGFGVSFHETYTARLSRMEGIAPGGQKMKTVNAGVPGYSSYQTLVQFQEEVPRLKPHTILIYQGLNDTFPSPSAYYTDLETSKRMGRMKQKVLRVFEALRIFSWIRSQLGAEKNEGEIRELARLREEFDQEGELKSYFPRVSQEDFEVHLRTMVKDGLKMQARVVLLTYPLSEKMRSFLPGVMKGYNDRTRTIAGEMGVTLVDIAREYSEWNDGNDMLQDGIHPTAEGHKRIAQAVQRALHDLQK